MKARLTGFDRAALIELVRDLHDASKENRTFLHARFGLGEDPLAPYKEIIDRWTWPDVFRNQDTSATKARQAVSDYKKAVGNPRGLAELMVYYCERGTGFSADIGNQDESFLNALGRMFGKALETIAGLPKAEQDQFLVRLYRVRDQGRRLAYGAGEVMDDLLASFSRNPHRIARS